MCRYDPRLPHVKAGQAHLLCKAVVDFRRELQQQGTMPPRGPLGQQQQQEEVPVLVCGDFNSLWKHDLRDPFNTWLSDGVSVCLGGRGLGRVVGLRLLFVAAALLCPPSPPQ